MKDDDFDAQDYLGPLKRDPRGFPYLQFDDFYDKPCMLHLSSIVEPECVWFGIMDPEPRIMARDAAAHGIKTKETTGWVPFPLPKAVHVSTQMHLTRQQVEALIPVLQRWVDTGEVIV